MCILSNTEMLDPVRSPQYFDGIDVLLEPVLGFQFRPAATTNSISSCKDPVELVILKATV